MQAIILAAGRGQRMQALTEQQPKPLLPLGNTTLIEHHLTRLAKAGITEVVINIAYLGEMIQDVVGDGRRYGLNVQWSKESQALESGGGIKKALKHLSGDFFCVVNADVLIDWNYRNLLHQPLESGKLGHLFLVNNPPHNPQGDFSLSHNLLIERTESCPGHTFSGISILHPTLFNEERRSYFKLASLLQAHMVQQRLTGSILSATWLDVGTPERLAEAQTMVQQLSQACY